MSLPAPYYQDKWATVYLGDNAEIVPDLENVDFTLTDPPWIARKDKIKRVAIGVAPQINCSRGIGYGSIGEFSEDLLALAFSKTRNDMLVICGYKELGKVIAVLEPIRGCLIWHKPNGGLTVAYPCPLDVAYIVWGAREKSAITGFQHWKSGVFSVAVPTAGCISNGERVLTEPNGPAAHPAQGPVKLYQDLIRPMEGTILDPYLGTGTTLVAAKRLGKRAVGIERHEPYAEIAARRIESENTLFDLVEPGPSITQPDLLPE